MSEVEMFAEATLIELVGLRYELAIIRGEAPEDALKNALSMVDRFSLKAKMPELQNANGTVKQSLREVVRRHNAR